MGRVLLLEPFYGGSHKQLLDVLCSLLPSSQFDLFTMSSKKWHWRARTSALYFAQQVPLRSEGDYSVIFCSCVLSLSELMGLRPDLVACKKIVYFHENQLTYPVQKVKERDFQFGYNQVTSALAADTVVFNSNYNMESFLANLPKLFKMQPDYRPNTGDIERRIREKSRVLYFPVNFARPLRPDVNNSKHPQIGEIEKEAYDNKIQEVFNCERSDGKEDKVVSNEDSQVSSSCEGSETIDSIVQKEKPDEECVKVSDPIDHKVGNDKSDECVKVSSETSETIDHKVGNDKSVLHILWPHRWEHDKNPDMFFRCLVKMKEEGILFRVSVLGETYTDVPEIFSSGRTSLEEYIHNFGFVESKEKYFEILEDCDVVVSTADHEFFGVAMLEAVFCSCFPLAPNRLVYPEIFPTQCLYNTEQQLFKRLKNFAKNPSSVKKCLPKIPFEKYSAPHLEKEYLELFAPYM